jgi:cytochrome c oxidase assembly protein subunit 15
MIASIVGMMTIGLAVWLWRVEPRRWVRQLGLVALATVILQGLLGGITVLYFLPTPVSVSHAGLAEIFFCLTVCLALFTSVGWRESGAADTHLPVVRDRTLLALATGLPVLVFVQILIGATMRHTGAGLAIPDFPLAFGRLVPPVWSFAIGVHFLHRLGALVTTLTILATVGHLLAHHRSRRDLVRPGGLLVLLVLIQVGLGGWTVLSGRAPVINTAHVATGAMVLGTALVIGLRANRHRFPDAGQVAAPPIGSTDLELAAPGASV